MLDVWLMWVVGGNWGLDVCWSWVMCLHLSLSVEKRLLFGFLPFPVPCSMSVGEVVLGQAVIGRHTYQIFLGKEYPTRVDLVNGRRTLGGCLVWASKRRLK